MEQENNDKLLKCYKRNDELKQEIKELKEKYNQEINDVMNGYEQT